MSLQLAQKILGGKSATPVKKPVGATPKKQADLARDVLLKGAVKAPAPKLAPRTSSDVNREKMRSLLMTPRPERVIELGGGAKEIHNPDGSVYRTDASGKPLETPRAVPEKTKTSMRGGKSFEESQLEIDHLIPKALGGTDDDTNLRAAKSKKTLTQAAFDFVTGNKRLPGDYIPKNRQEGKMVVEWEAINQYKAGKISLEQARNAVRLYDNTEFVASVLGPEFAKTMPTDKGEPVKLSSLIFGTTLASQGNAIASLGKSAFFKVANLLGETKMFKTLAEKVDASPAAAGALDAVSEFGGDFKAGLKPQRENIPVAGTLLEWKDLARVKSISDKLNSNQPITDEDKKFLTDVYARKDAEAEKNKKLGYRSGRTIAAAQTFMLELRGAALLAPATGGASAFTLVAAKAATWKGAKELAELLAKKEFQAMAMRDLGTFAVNASIKGGIQASVHIPEGAVERMVGSPIRNEQGDFTEFVNQQSASDAVRNSTIDNLIETGTEFMGGGFKTTGRVAFELLGKPTQTALLKAGFLKVLIKKNPSLTPSVVQSFMKKAGWDGVLEEIGEERLGDALRIIAQGGGATSDYQYQLPTLGDIFVEVFSFAFMGTAVNTLDRLVSTPAPVLEKQEREREEQMSQQTEQVVEAIKTEIENGKAPAAVGIELSKSVGTEVAQALVQEAVLDLASPVAEPKAAPTATATPSPVAVATPKPAEGEKTQPTDEAASQATTEARSPLADLADKLNDLGEKALEKTAADLHSEFHAANEKAEAELTDVKAKIRELEDKLETLSPRSKDRAGIKEQIAVLEKQVRQRKGDVEEDFLVQADHLRAQMRKRLEAKYPNVNEDALDTVVGRISDIITDSEIAGDSYNTTLAELTDIVGENMLGGGTVDMDGKPVKEGDAFADDQEDDNSEMKKAQEKTGASFLKLLEKYKTAPVVKKALERNMKRVKQLEKLRDTAKKNKAAPEIPERLQQAIDELTGKTIGQHLGQEVIDKLKPRDIAERLKFAHDLYDETPSAKELTAKKVVGFEPVEFNEDHDGGGDNGLGHHSYVTDLKAGDLLIDGEGKALYATDVAEFDGSYRARDIGAARDYLGRTSVRRATEAELAEIFGMGKMTDKEAKAAEKKKRQDEINAEVAETTHLTPTTEGFDEAKGREVAIKFLKKHGGVPTFIVPGHSTRTQGHFGYDIELPEDGKFITVAPITHEGSAVAKQRVKFKTKELLKEAGLDKSNKKANDKAYDQDSGSGDRQGDDAEAGSDGGNGPDGAGTSTDDAGEGERDDAGDGGGELGERSTARRLTNEEVQKVVESVTRISESGEVEITGRVTKAVLEAASQYQTGGVSKQGRGILDEYYTSATIVDMVKSALNLPEAGLKVLEPSVGTGNFLRALPEGHKHTVQGYEINPVTARIAKIFNQAAHISNTPFEEIFIDKRGKKVAFDTTYDLVIGNPPYGDHRGLYLGLGEEKDIKRYEEYFIKRGLDLLKEGGTLAMVVPSGFLRGGNSKAKEAISKMAHLVEAWRLPNGVFDGTDVGTDIVIFKKAKAQSREQADDNMAWMSADRWLNTNPAHILGEQKQRKGKFGMEAFVEGSIDDAIAKFHANSSRREALEVLEKTGLPATPENVEIAQEAVEEAGEDKADALVTEAKKKGKEVIEKKVKQTTTKKDKVVSLASHYEGEFSDTELAYWKATRADGSLDMEKVGRADPTLINKMGGKWFLDLNYLQGDIYEKLDTLEKEKSDMDAEQYARQKAKLLAVLPARESVSKLLIAPNTQFVADLMLKDDEGNPVSLQKMFLGWVRELPHGAFGQSSSWEVAAYVENDQVRGNDAKHNEAVRVRRREVAERLFSRYVREELSEADKTALEDAYNRAYNFFYTPDYKKVPMFADIHATFEGKTFKPTDTQKHGVGRLVNTGGGILAHEVGFGKTISGILAAHETMKRGWAKKPLIVVPSDQIMRQWVKTINQLIPNAKINTLGNLGAAFAGDLGSLKIEDGSFTFVTYEGLERLAFKDATYDKLSASFAYIADDLKAERTKRDEEKSKQKEMETQGKMRKGARGDLFFEDLGFDHFTMDEAHNANHIVSKVKLPKGQASEFNQFSQRSSGIGMKTWLAAKYIQDLNDGRNVNLLTATPFTNHPLEYYSMLALVADKSLAKMGGNNVNEFFQMFMEAESQYEFKADGSYQKKTDVRRFRNFRQFRKLLDSHIDFKTDDPTLVRPERVQQNYEIPQNAYGQSLEKLANELFKDKENAGTLKAIGELRKIAFSPFASRFHQGGLPDYKKFVEESPKIRTLMALLGQNLKDKPDAGQIVYVDDVGVGFLPDMKQYMVKEMGLKADEVEIISGATPKAKRPDIQARFNEGKVKVIIGSEAIKEGMNLQQNSTDLYILSLPWNFTQLRQVIGRLWRQGNRWKNVRINNLFIQDSIDIFLSQKLDNKQKRYEAALASGDNQVDVGDVDYNELKFALVKDPEMRAKLEIASKGEELTRVIDQNSSELAFIEKKAGKSNDLRESIENYGKFIERQKQEMEGNPNDAEFYKGRIAKYERDRTRAEKDLKDHEEQLKARGLTEEVLSSKASTLALEIAKMKDELKALNEKTDERIKEIAASMPAPVEFSPKVVEGFVADRAEHNKTFYQLREDKAAEKVATIAPTVEKKEIKNAAGTKVLETKKVVKVKRTSQSKASKETAVLADANLTVSQKVDALLSVKQEGKKFKDVGDRVAGSKKERAAIKAVVQMGDQAMMDELVLRLGMENVAQVYDKDTILEDTPKPDPAADKEAGVPSLIAYVKKDIFNKIPKVFTPSTTTGTRYKSHRSNLAITELDDDARRHSVMIYGSNPEHKLFIARAFKEYPAMLREFVSKLTAVQTAEDLAKFWGWYTETYGQGGYAASGREFEQDGKTLLVYPGIFGRNVADYTMPASPYSYGDESPVRFFDTLKRNLIDKDRSVLTSGFLNNQRWWDKAMGKREDREDATDLAHGNFKPMEHIRRTAPAIPAARVKAETLKTELGFKSVQFGNYMDDVTSKEHIRHTIGAVEDIATALDINLPKLINDLGLSIAYGARGGSKFLAHYEPTHNIINLTKGKGDGSFFHEFAHFLDFTMPKKTRGLNSRWSSKNAKWQRGDALGQAAVELMGTIDGSYFRAVKEFKPRESDETADEEIKKMYEDGKTLEEAVETASTKSGWRKSQWLQDIADVYRKPVSGAVQVWNEPTEYIKNSGTIGGDYWTRPEELLARAAQAYIEDKMAEKGMVNDYVTRPTKATEKEDYYAKAYPQGEERQRINAEFDKLFARVRELYPSGAAGLEALKKALRTAEVFEDLDEVDRLKKQIADLESGKKPQFKRTTEAQKAKVWEAVRVVADYRNRLGIDFDVHFVDAFLVNADPSGMKKMVDKRLQGLTADNTIALLKDMAKTTTEHEICHIVLNNLDRLEVFTKEGLTRRKILEAKAAEMGVSLSGNLDAVDEQLAQDFEKYLADNEAVGITGVIRKFFVILKRMMLRFLTAVRVSKGGIVLDYYDILSEGQAVDAEIVRFENKGILQAFTEDGQMDVDDLEAYGLSQFKRIEDATASEEGDKRLSDLEAGFNTAAKAVENVQGKLETWKAELDTNLVSKEELSSGVAETPEEIRKLSRFRRRTEPTEISPRGKQEIAATFDDPQAVEEQLGEYLLRKTQLVETRNRLRQLRNDIAAARREGKAERASLRDLERRLKLRRRVLERNDHYIDLGRIRGRKEGVKFVMRRKEVISKLAGQVGLTPKKMRELVGARHIETMTEADFNDFIVGLTNRARSVKKLGLGRQDIVARIEAMDLKNTDALRQAMKLPTIANMKQEDVDRFLAAISGYRVGDIFLTRRELETIHRTDWGEIKTQRELVEKLEQHTGIPRGSLASLRAPDLKGNFSSWISLARRHPFWNWLVGKRFEATVIAEKEYHEIEKEIFALTNAARRSRNPHLTLKERLVQVVVPTDELIGKYLETEDKAAFAKENNMTPEELALADRLIALYQSAYEYLSGEYGMKGRRNYMTHVRRSFLETIKDDGLKSALKEAFDGQREDEAAFNILDGKTGEVLAFEKFLGYTQQRKNVIVPTKNIAKATTAYFRALTRKKALDAFVPEAMLAVKAHAVITGKTAKGLDKDPRVETFVKKWLNDAKGRKIDFMGVEHGSKPEVALRIGTALVSLKYLGFNFATGLASIIGDHVAVARALTLKEAGRGLVRTVLHPFQSAEVTKEFRGFIGLNPLAELLAPNKNLPSRVKDLAMMLFALGAYQSEKFYLRAKLTDQEFEDMVASDERMAEIARELSKWKRTKFYIPSLAGSTTIGKANFQFGSWAVPIFNTTLSDLQGTLAAVKSGSWAKLSESEQARSLLKTGLHIAIGVFLASLIPPPDDDDKSPLANLRRKAQRELTSLFQALQFVTDPTNYFLVAQQIGEIMAVISLALSQEKYEKDGEGYIRGDAKWLQALKRVLTPTALRQFDDREERNAKDELLDEAARNGTFDAAAIGEFLNPEKWAETGEDADKYRARIQAELTVLYNVKRKYPDSRVAPIITEHKKNADRIAALMELANEIGIEAVELEIKTLRGDEELRGAKGSGASDFISSNLYKAFLEAARRYEAAGTTE